MGVGNVNADISPDLDYTSDILLGQGAHIWYNCREWMIACDLKVELPNGSIEILLGGIPATGTGIYDYQPQMTGDYTIILQGQGSALYRDFRVNEVSIQDIINIEDRLNLVEEELDELIVSQNEQDNRIDILENALSLLKEELERFVEMLCRVFNLCSPTETPL